jgi:hypothetical protein
MGMPWESPPPRREPSPPVQPPVPQQQPVNYSTAQQPYPAPPQQMQPDIPLVARNPQTGEAVRVDVGADLREAIRQAITQSVVENKDAMVANSQKAIAKAVDGQKISVKQDDTEIEGEMEFGASSKRTLIQGLAVDVGFALTAAAGMVMNDSFDFGDPEQWKILGLLLVKTLIQTGMSFLMRLKVE